MYINQTMGAFGAWWRDQLLSLVPVAVKSWLESLRVRHRLSVESDGAKMFRRGWFAANNWKQLKGISGEPGDLSKQLRPWLAGLGFRRTVLVTVPVEQLLTRTIDLPTGVATNLSDIARLEARALVPGSGSSAYAGLDPAGIKIGSKSVSALQLVLNGKIVDRYTTALKAEKGLDCEVAALFEDGRVVHLDPLIDTRTDAHVGTRWRPVLAALVLVLAAANTFITITRQEEAITVLDQELAVATQKAQAVRERLNRQAALANGVVGIQQKMQHEPRLIDIWQELTNLLPRSAWINSLVIEDRTLRIVGSAQSAAELIGLLDASDVLSQVRFSSPVVTNRASNEERFQIEARIGGAQ